MRVCILCHFLLGTEDGEISLKLKAKLRHLYFLIHTILKNLKGIKYQKLIGKNYFNSIRNLNLRNLNLKIKLINQKHIFLEAMLEISKDYAKDGELP